MELKHNVCRKLEADFFVFAALLLLASSFSTYAQDVNGFSELRTQDKPKIGLVLSGGGAKGMAHIGILEALEEAGITPDFITGTSMGSIIGGLYACGYSAAEIKQIALSADWDELLTNKLFLNEVVFEEKDYYNRYINEVGLNGLKPVLPQGLIEGQKLTLLLTRLTRPVSNINDFSKLPIPYACIAADIENGDKVVLNSGSLARSMRASMAIPSVFTPVTINERLLVDGGLVHNFPVDENIEMGADYIIGVFVGNSLLKKEEIGSPINVLTQSAFIHGSFDTEKQKKLVDMYIEPDLKGLSPADFGRADEIIEIGEHTGRMFVEKFKRLNDSLSALGRTNMRVSLPVSEDKVTINRIEVVDNKVVSTDFITGRLKIRENTAISIDELEKNLTGLYGTGLFTKILYNISPPDNGSVLTVDVTENPEGKLRAALNYNNETKVALLLNFNYRNLILDNSRILFETELSENPLVDANYLKYFGKGNYFGFSSGYYFRNTNFPELSDRNISSLYDFNYNRFYTGFHSSHVNNRTLRLLYTYEISGLDPKIAAIQDRVFEKMRFSGHNIDFKYEHNSLDNRYFPARGSNYGADLRYLIKGNMTLVASDTLFPDPIKAAINNKLTGKFYHRLLIPVSEKITFGIENNLSLVLYSDSITAVEGFDFLNTNLIGGFRKLSPNVSPFYGAKPMSYYATNLFGNSLMFQYALRKDLFFKLESQYYFANPLGSLISSIGKGDYYTGGKHYLIAGAATIGYESPLGPVSFSAGKGNNNSGLQVYLNIGFYFDRK